MTKQSWRVPFEKFPEFKKGNVVSCDVPVDINIKAGDKIRYHFDNETGSAEIIWVSRNITKRLFKKTFECKFKIIENPKVFVKIEDISQIIC